MKSETAPLLLQKEVALYHDVAHEVVSDDKNGFEAAGSSNDNSSILDSAAVLHHRTNALETFIHLIKGYIGAGMLSLPWAFSCLGIAGGVGGVCTLSFWTSYNCYTVVSIKRYMARTTIQQQSTADINDDRNDRNSETSSNITYPDVGEWAYGTTFQAYVSACIIVQQLAVCTVYVSFVGENLQAVLHHFNLPSSHVQVMSMALPAILLLSFIPSLKQLAPVMAVGTALLLFSLASLSVIVGLQWEDRPDAPPEMVISKVPLALCAIIYSYEGICIILPVESAMAQPDRFGPVFISTMVVVAALYAVVGTICVTTFGNVTSGSLTAFLLDNFGTESEKITNWVNVANTAVSLSVLLTYPLTIWPALELLSISVANSTSCWAKCLRGGKEAEKEEDDLAAFEPLPSLPEDGVAPSIDDTEVPLEHLYEQEAATNPDEGETTSASGMSASVVDTLVPNLSMPGDSLQLRALLVLSTYLIAVAVPNVQALISLAGAVAGSSTALIIPPLLELAWIEHLEHCELLQGKSGANPSSPIPTAASPHIIRASLRRMKHQQQQKKKRHLGRWTSGNYWKDKIKCYVLLVFGAVFMGIGTYVSIVDIVKIYLGIS